MGNKIIPMMAIIAAVSCASADLLIGWDGGTTTNTAFAASGVGGTLFANRIYAVDATAGSTDGTFGSGIAGADTAATAYAVRLSNPGSNNTVAVQIQNNTVSNLQLETFSFDYTAWFANSPRTVTLSYAYGNLNVVDGTVINSISDIPVTGKLSNYNDYDWSLTGLADYILAPGERATFALVGSVAVSATTNGAFDNVAISGSVIPEPATLGLIGSIATSLLFVRRLTA